MTLAKTTLAGALCAISLAAPLALAGTERPAGGSPAAYYLALGDSMAFGFQPTKATKPPSKLDPAAFRTGYVDVFAAQLRKLSPKIRVINYGCPGETTVTFAKGGCDWLKGGGKLHNAFRGSQLKAAEAFLRAHPGKVSPITVTLWGADLAPLSAAGQGREELDRGVRVALHPDPRAAARSCAERRDHRQRSVEPGGRQAGEGRAPLSLGRCGHQEIGDEIARSCRRHVRGAERSRELQSAEGTHLLADVLLSGPRPASDRRRVPREGERLSRRVELQVAD